MSNRRQAASARQLSLVAYLLYSDGRARDEAEIRRNLPAYLEVYASSRRGDESRNDLAADALRKGLERDVDALSTIGIHVEIEGRPDGRRYRLDAENFSSLELEVGADERAVLVGALRSLRRDFPYLGPLKLALANMIGSFSEDASIEKTAAFAAVATRDDERVAARLGVLERAVNRRKRVRFEYYGIHADETSTRELEPYALSLLEGLWYVTGWDTERGDVRQFRLSRIRGRVTFATKRDADDFDVPENFERRRVGPRAPWQLDEPHAKARIRVSDEAYRTARRRYGFAFSVGPWREDGTVDLHVPYAGERQLAGWILSMGDEAEVLAPSSLAERVEAGLRKILEAHA